MKHFLLASLIAASIVQTIPASPKGDSLLSFTGATRAKFIWYRRAWANESYVPISPAVTSLMLFDTQEGTERALYTGNEGFSMQRISRSGKWATWNDMTGKRTYIIDLTNPSATRQVFLESTTTSYWCARAFWIDPKTSTEYSVCHGNFTTVNSNNGPTEAWIVPITATGTADKANAKKLNVKAPGLPMDEMLSMSADGTKLGVALPWPDTYIVDLLTGTAYGRHWGDFGCQSNLAPDNSYRFYHCQGDHVSVTMFDKDMSTTYWEVPMNKGIPGMPSGEMTAFAAPRWTNNVQYTSNSYPLPAEIDVYGDDYVTGKDANFVKTQVQVRYLGCFVLQKFAADFKTIEKTMDLAADVRYKQYGGDCWLSNGITLATSIEESATGKRSTHPNLEFSLVDGRLMVAGSAHGHSVVRLTDVQGRLVRHYSGTGSAMVDTRGLAEGAYALAVSNQSGDHARRISISR